MLNDRDPAIELEEYRQLRATIRERGSLRVVLFVVTVAVWAVLAVLVSAFLALPLASLVPLILLTAGFEAVHVLHIATERVGRYLYVRYESGMPRMQWEGAIATFGAGHRSFTRPAAALFPLVFAAAAVVNFLVATLGATASELIAIGAAHVLVLARMFMATRAATGQRAEDQRRFEDVLK